MGFQKYLKDLGAQLLMVSEGPVFLIHKSVGVRCLNTYEDQDNLMLLCIKSHLGRQLGATDKYSSKVGWYT